MPNKNVRKAAVIGAVAVCAVLVLFVVLRSLRGGGGGQPMPEWTPSPDAFSFGQQAFTFPPQQPPLEQAWQQQSAWGDGIPSEWADEPSVPATQMPTTVPTEPSPWPLGGPFILPAGA